MNTTYPLIAVLLITLTVGPPAQADELPALSAALYAADDEAAAGDEPYRAGRQALDQKRWSQAARLFAESAASGSDHADAAHYWQAYALHKDGRSAEALEVLGALRQAFPDSSWLDDAGALKLEIRQGSGATAGDADNNELKLLALNAFMSSDSDRALPLLAKFLAGDHPQDLRERALFVLSQHDSAEAATMLLEVARGEKHPELRMRAVHYLGISDAPGSGDALAEIYRDASDKEVKSAVLHSFMVSDEHDFLLDLAKTEPDPELRREAIHQLGVMDATGALRELYASESSPEVKDQILHSMFIGDDAEGLLQIIRTERDGKLRRAGIRSLGLVGSEEATAALAEIYDGSSDTETREAIIEALFLSDDAGELIRIARAESDPELRKKAFHRLSLMDDDEALDFMMEVLEN